MLFKCSAKTNCEVDKYNSKLLNMNNEGTKDKPQNLCSTNTIEPSQVKKEVSDELLVIGDNI